MITRYTQDFGRSSDGNGHTRMLHSNIEYTSLTNPVPRRLRCILSASLHYLGGPASENFEHQWLSSAPSGYTAWDLSWQSTSQQLPTNGSLRQHRTGAGSRRTMIANACLPHTCGIGSPTAYACYSTFCYFSSSVRMLAFTLTPHGISPSLEVQASRGSAGPISQYRA